MKKNIKCQVLWILLTFITGILSFHPAASADSMAPAAPVNQEISATAPAQDPESPKSVEPAPAVQGQNPEQGLSTNFLSDSLEIEPYHQEPTPQASNTSKDYNQKISELDEEKPLNNPAITVDSDEEKTEKILDGNGRVKEIVVTGPAGNFIYKKIYEYDNQNRVIKETVVEASDKIAYVIEKFYDQKGISRVEEYDFGGANGDKRMREIWKRLADGGSQTTHYDETGRPAYQESRDDKDRLYERKWFSYRDGILIETLTQIYPDGSRIIETTAKHQPGKPDVITSRLWDGNKWIVQ